MSVQRLSRVYVANAICVMDLEQYSTVKYCTKQSNKNVVILNADTSQENIGVGLPMVAS